MHRLKLLGLTMIVVLALAAVASASASAALPEFVLGTSEVFPDKFEASATFPGAQAQFTISNVGYLQCKRLKLKGEITSAKAVSLTDEMSECEIGQNEPECNTVGAAKGVVVMQGTSGTVAYINKATKQVGIVLTLKTGKISCGEGVEEEVKGSLIGSITPINTKTTNYELSWQAPGGKQAFTQYENEKGEKVKAAPILVVNGNTGNTGFDVPEALKLKMSKAVTISA